MSEEFEKFQKQLKDLENKKISRQKNQTLPEYKAALRQRREYDEQIMVLKEQKEIISDDRFNVSELKAKYESEFIKQLKKIEDDKDKMSKRTYQRHKKNVTDRYNARIKALEGLNEELLQSDREEMQAKFDAKIEETRKERKQNEDKINDLKLENDKRNLEIDRAIYYINKTQLKRIDEEISKTSEEIEELNNSMSQKHEEILKTKGKLEDMSHEDEKVLIDQMKELSKKQLLLEQYQAQKDEFTKRNEKFTKKTLEKIAELKPESKQEIKKEEKQDIKREAEAEKKEADEKKHKLDIGKELFRNMRKKDFIEAGGKIIEKVTDKEDENKEENNSNIINVRLIVGQEFPFLRYSTLDKEKKYVYGYTDYKMGKSVYPFDSYNEICDFTEEIAENAGLDSDAFKGIDPFLIHYLSNTNSELLKTITDDLKNGKGLESLKGIIRYDMSNADDLKRRDKRKFNKRIAAKAQNNGFEVKGHEKLKTVLSKMMEKLTHKKARNYEMLESPRVENDEKNKVENYKNQYKSKTSRITSAMSMGIADPMKFVKKDQKEKSIDE